MNIARSFRSETFAWQSAALRLYRWHIHLVYRSTFCGKNTCKRRGKLQDDALPAREQHPNSCSTRSLFMHSSSSSFIEADSQVH